MYYGANSTSLKEYSIETSDHVSICYSQLTRDLGINNPITLHQKKEREMGKRPLHFAEYSAQVAKLFEVNQIHLVD